MKKGSPFPKELLEIMHGKYPSLPSVEEMLQDPDISIFFQAPLKDTTSNLKVKERVGVYNDKKCDARIWITKKNSGGLGYDNIQCNKNKTDGCFCHTHSKMYSNGTLWTGKITEPRPEEPQRIDGRRMFWSTDKNGNDIIKEGKSIKEIIANNKEPKEMSIDELYILLKEKEEEGDEEGEEGGLGAGVGFEEEWLYILKTINNVEYQINTEDNIVIRLHDFKIIGTWDNVKKEITFNEI